MVFYKRRSRDYPTTVLPLHNLTTSRHLLAEPDDTGSSARSGNHNRISLQRHEHSKPHSQAQQATTVSFTDR